MWASTRGGGVAVRGELWCGHRGIGPRGGVVGWPMKSEGKAGRGGLGQLIGHGQEMPEHAWMVVRKAMVCATEQGRGEGKFPSARHPFHGRAERGNRWGMNGWGLIAARWWCAGQQHALRSGAGETTNVAHSRQGQSA